MATSQAYSRPRGGVLDDVLLTHVTSLAELDEFRRWASGRLDGLLCCDTESDGLSPYRDRHRLTQVGDKRHGWAFPPQWMGAVHEVLRGYRGRIGFWNLPYDHRVLEHQSGTVLPWAQLDDISLAAHIADNTATNKLKPRAARDIDPSANTGEKLLAAARRANKWTYATVPGDLPEYWMYAAMDPVLTSWEADAHMPLVLARYRHSYDLELATARICSPMMDAGMMIDRPFIEAKRAEIAAWNAATMAKLGSVGVSSVESNEQVGRALERFGVTLRRTRTGQPEISKDAMEDYEAQCPWAAEMIRDLRWARKAQSILGRYLGKFLEMADGEIMHYSIHTCQAKTSRMSCTDPAMHTYDRDVPVIRGSFRPRPGHVFICWDAQQIEARMAANFCRDQRMIADFLEADATGQSFFVLASGRIYGHEVSKDDPRYTWTKNATYAQIYGASEAKAAVTAGVTVEQMHPVYSGFKQTYPGVGRKMRQLIDSARNGRGRPQVRTLSGRRLLGDTGAEYKLLNMWIQGSCAEILKSRQAMVDAAGYGELLRLDIHDEIMAECPEREAKAVLREVTEILNDRTSFPVPILWSGKIHKERWVK